MRLLLLAVGMQIFENMIGGRGSLSATSGGDTVHVAHGLAGSAGAVAASGEVGEDLGEPAAEEGAKSGHAAANDGEVDFDGSPNVVDLWECHCQYFFFTDLIQLVAEENTEEGLTWWWLFFLPL